MRYSGPPMTLDGAAAAQVRLMGAVQSVPASGRAGPGRGEYPIRGRLVVTGTKRR